MLDATTDLTACDREPIHLSGAIQPHGCLIAINLSNCTVEFVSKNVSDFLNIDEKSLLNAPQRAFEEAMAEKPISNIHSGQTEGEIKIAYKDEGEVYKFLLTMARAFR